MNGLTDDRDDDVRLPVRGSDRRSAMRDEAAGRAEQDREFTLSTGTVLGIFFALALVCAVFFGFGYSMGRKSGVASAADTAASSTAAPDAAPEAAVAKPSAGTPAIQAIPGYMSASQADAANRNANAQTARPSASAAPTTVVVTEAPVPRVAKPAPAAAEATNEQPAAPVVRKPHARLAQPAAVPQAPPAPAPGATGNYVQIAAVSHQEDADVLLSALKRRGYAVFERPGDTDKLIHVQVGPFATKKDADAMRQKLLGDGYNAIVK